VHVEVRLLLEVCLDGDSAGVHIIHNEHLLDRHWLASDKAWAKVNSRGAELDARLASTSSKLEIVLRATHDLQLELVVLEVVLSNWQVGDFELDLFSFRHASSLWGDRDVLVGLSLPDEIEVELSTVA
jgi:hypothetical protein